MLGKARIALRRVLIVREQANVAVTKQIGLLSSLWRAFLFFLMY